MTNQSRVHFHTISANVSIFDQPGVFPGKKKQ